jgi:hypothetical protein
MPALRYSLVCHYAHYFSAQVADMPMQLATTIDRQHTELAVREKDFIGFHQMFKGHLLFHNWDVRQVRVFDNVGSHDSFNTAAIQAGRP